jgi:hypothetical protein
MILNTPLQIHHRLLRHEQTLTTACWQTTTQFDLQPEQAGFALSQPKKSKLLIIQAWQEIAERLCRLGSVG